MAETVAEGGVKVTADTSQLKAGMNQATASLKTYERAVENLNLVVTGAYAFMGLQVVGFAAKSLQAGANFQQRHAGFVNLVKGDTDKFLNDLRRATQGTVTDIELMTSTNRALLLGFSQEQLPLMFEAAEKLGSAVGVNASDAFDTLTLAMSTQSERMLKTVGITIDAERAYQEYVDSMGRARSELTDLEREQIFNTLTIQALIDANKNLNTDLDEQADKLEKAKVKWQSFLDTLNKGALTTFETYYDAFANKQLPVPFLIEQGLRGNLLKRGETGENIGGGNMGFGGGGTSNIMGENITISQEALFVNTQLTLRKKELLELEILEGKNVEKNLKDVKGFTEELKNLDSTMVSLAKRANNARTELDAVLGSVSSGATLNRETGTLLTSGGVVKRIIDKKLVIVPVDKK